MDVFRRICNFHKCVKYTQSAIAAHFSRFISVSVGAKFRRFLKYFVFVNESLSLSYLSAASRAVTARVLRRSHHGPGHSRRFLVRWDLNVPQRNQNFRVISTLIISDLIFDSLNHHPCRITPEFNNQMSFNCPLLKRINHSFVGMVVHTNHLNHFNNNYPNSPKMSMPVTR